MNGAGDWVRGLRRRQDLALPAVLAVIQLGATFAATRHLHKAGEQVVPGVWLLLAAGPAALAFRRRFPVAVLWLTFAAVLGPPAARFAYLSLIAAFFTAVTSGHRRAAWTVLASGFAGSLWLTPWLWDRPGFTLEGALLLGGWLAMLAVAAEAVRIRQDHRAQAQAARRAEARRQASDERLRMARDLHDVIGHTISLINVQAAVGLDLMDERPEQAREALTAIKAASHEALDELRIMLAALRHAGENQTAEKEEAPRAPAPGLSRLPELADLARAAGLSVVTEVTGPPQDLPAAVDLAAYRIIQESLTNVARHAGPVTAFVRLGYRPGRLEVSVTDTGPAGRLGPAGAGSGSGIAGMRERAAALGGHVEAGPRPSGGFGVTARLPLPSAGPGPEPGRMREEAAGRGGTP